MLTIYSSRMETVPRHYLASSNLSVSCITTRAKSFLKDRPINDILPNIDALYPSKTLTKSEEIDFKTPHCVADGGNTRSN